MLALAREVSAHRARATAAGARFLLTDGGDWFQGTPEGNTSMGRLVIDVYAELGMSFATLGNHEFDFGFDNARSLVARAKHPVLAANVRTRDGRLPPWLRESRILDVHGLRVAIVGLVTKDTRLQSTGPFGGLQFEDELACLRRVLPKLRARSDAIILLTHCGYLRDRAIAKAFPEIRLILGGHSHTALLQAARVGDTTIVQTGGKASAYYLVELDVDLEKRALSVRRARHRMLAVKAGDGEHPLARFLETRTRELRAEWDRAVGQLGAPLESSRGLTNSTTAGNLVADLIREAGAASVGVMNRGGLRATLRAGVVTKRHVYELLPFENDVVAMDLTGAELRAVLLEGLQKTRRPFEVSGMSYAVRQRGESAFEISRLKIGGVDLDDAKLYRVATNSFLAGGGDGAASFVKGRRRKRSGVMLRELLLQALQSVEKLDASREARIRVLD